jgi:hypothetical protein
VTVSVVVLAGSVAADPLQRRMPIGDEVADVSLTEAERDRLTGTFDERLKVATVAMALSLVTIDDNSSGDASPVDVMCPSDYELRLSRFIVEHHQQADPLRCVRRCVRESGSDDRGAARGGRAGGCSQLRRRSWWS